MRARSVMNKAGDETVDGIWCTSSTKTDGDRRQE